MSQQKSLAHNNMKRKFKIGDIVKITARSSREFPFGALKNVLLIVVGFYGKGEHAGCKVFMTKKVFGFSYPIIGLLEKDLKLVL